MMKAVANSVSVICGTLSDSFSDEHKCIVRAGRQLWMG